MRHEKAFDTFLKNIVNLNQTRIDVAKSATEAITSYLENSTVFSKLFILTQTQGSFRQKTIIKPVDEDCEFDVDLLFELKKVEGWEAKDYLQNIAAEFRKSDRYKEKVDTRGKNRCVTIDYESDFHLDIVPAIKIGHDYHIMNKYTNQFEITDGDGYAEWFENVNKITGANNLIKVVRLVKFIRDYCGAFEIKSILLTTLIGQQVKNTDLAYVYPDLPTSFITLLARLDEYIQANPIMPIVNNPVMPSENFNRHWDQTKYSQFRDKLHEYKLLASDAFNEPDSAQSLEKWQKVFGEFFKGETDDTSSTELKRDPGEQFLSDYDIAENLRYSLRINARLNQKGFRTSLLRSTNWLRKQRSLEFFIESCNVPGQYSVKWKVKNKGTEAKKTGDLRGQIYDDNGSQTRRENSRYEGAHYVECYIIQNGVCVAKDRIDVPIGKN